MTSGIAAKDISIFILDSMPEKMICLKGLFLSAILKLSAREYFSLFVFILSLTLKPRGINVIQPINPKMTADTIKPYCSPRAAFPFVTEFVKISPSARARG